MATSIASETMSSIPSSLAQTRPVGDQRLEITITKTALLSELKYATALSDSITPETSCVVIRSISAAHATVIATNLEQWFFASVQCRVVSPGAVAIPAKKFYEYVRSLPDAPITIKVEPRDGMPSRVIVQAKRSKSSFSAHDPSRLSIRPQVDSAFLKLPARSLDTMARLTEFAVSSQDPRYVLCGALLEVEPAFIRIVATDGNRLAAAYERAAGETPAMQAADQAPDQTKGATVRNPATNPTECEPIAAHD